MVRMHRILFPWLCLICFSSSSRAQLFSKKTILTATFEDTVKFRQPGLAIWDYSTLTNTKDLPSLSPELLDGRWRFELRISHPVFVQLNGVLLNVIAYNTFSKFFFMDGIFLEPGDSVSVEVNKPDESTGFIFPRLHYSGRGAEKMICQQEIFQKTNAFSGANAPGNLQRFGLTDSVIAMILRTMNAYSLSPTARSILKATLIPMLTPDISEVVIGNQASPGMDIRDPAVKRLYRERLEANSQVFDLQDSALRYCGIDFWGRDWMRRRALLEYAMDKEIAYPEKFSLAAYKALISYLARGPLKERVLMHYVEKGIEEAIDNAMFNRDAEADSVTHLFLAMENKKGIYYKYLYEKWDNLKNGLVKRSPAFPFVLPDTSGNMVSLEELKGKVVLMDFMFNNCLPCRQMIPYLKNIAKNYRTEDFVILTVCADKKREQWMQAIAHAEGLPAIYCYTEGKGFDHPLIRHYAIHAYPTLVLLDRQGKLVTPRAPDPRDDQGQALNSLIKATLSSN